MRVILQASKIQMIPSRRRKLEESCGDGKKTSHKKAKTLEHKHAGLLKLFHLSQIASGHRERQRSGLLFYKNPLSFQ
jgi:hypothetical protein